MHLLPAVAIAVGVVPGIASAEAKLVDRVQTVVALRANPPCCVVDARSATQRQRHPLKDGVVWTPNVRITPAGPVVVVADDDKAGLAVAKKIEQRFDAKTVLVVKGGFETWEGIQAAGRDAGMPATFVIPMNTCEQGKPLQTLRSDRR